MRARDVAQALAAKLPMLVDNFTTNIGIASLTCSGTTVTATTAEAHGIPAGEVVTITGATTPIEISTFTRTGTIGTIVTAEDHDLTKSTRTQETLYADTSGANEAEFNGSFEIASIPNRRTINVVMADSGATVATGLPLLDNGAGCYSEYNGSFEVETTPTETTFTYSVASSLYSPATLNSSLVKRAARIVPTITIQRIVDQFTELEAPTQNWMFVTLGDVTASKSRLQQSDAVDNTQRQSWYRQQVLQDVSLFVVIPTDNDMAASDARDQCEDLLLPICQSILMKKFDTGLTNSKLNPLQFVSHGFALYNTAYYMHGYTFQQVADTSFGDTVGEDCDVAFRDISMSIGTSIGNGTIDTNINLDNEPLA